jgi:hypothetical protein
MSICSCKKCRANPPIANSELKQLLDHYGDEKRLHAQRILGLAPPETRCSLAGMVYAAAAELQKRMAEG